MEKLRADSVRSNWSFFSKSASPPGPSGDEVALVALVEFERMLDEEDSVGERSEGEEKPRFSNSPHLRSVNERNWAVVWEEEEDVTREIVDPAPGFESPYIVGCGCQLESGWQPLVIFGTSLCIAVRHRLGIFYPIHECR